MAPRAAGLLVLLVVDAAWAAQGAGTVAPGAGTILFPPPGQKGPASVPHQALHAGGVLSVRVEPKRPVGRATAALRGVAWRLQRLVGAADGAGNLLLSPLSVAAALGQLLLGARGETRVLLADLLDAPGPTRSVPTVSLGGAVLIPDLEYHQQFKALLELLRADDAPAASVELRVASAFFAQRGLPLRADFQHALHDLYQADVRPVDFRERPAESAAQVNAWAQRATRGRIPTVLAQPLPPSTAALVASAVYFRGAWATPFDPDLTATGWFALQPSSRRVAVRFMRGHFPDMPYYDAPGLGYRLVVLPYKGGQTAMYVVLPDDKDVDLRTFTASMSLDGMMAAARAARPQSVTLVLPRMNIAGSFSLKEPLSNLRRTRRLRRSAAAQESGNHILAARSEPRARAVDSASTPPVPTDAPMLSSTGSALPVPVMHSSGTSEGVAPSRQSSPIGTWSSAPGAASTPPAVPASSPPPTDFPPYVSPIVGPASPPPAPAPSSPAGASSSTEAAPLPQDEPQEKPVNALAVGSQGVHGLRPRPSAPDAFADVDLDLTGASNQTLRVSDALHHVWLEVTETGTEAVAITTTLVDYSGDDQRVVVNRPFVVAIVHEPSEALLFWAAVNDPTGGAGIRTDVAPAPAPAPAPRGRRRSG